MKRLFYILVCMLLCGCMDYGPLSEEEFSGAGRGVFIVCEGNFTYGNASLSYYDVQSRQVAGEVFARANAVSLGDVAQSMTILGQDGYIAVNNSGAVLAMDINTFRIKGIIKGLTSPRYIHFVSPQKAYITDLYAPQITVFDPRTLQITGRISTGRHNSTERMVQWGPWVMAACWSYDNKILVIDSRTDTVVDSITVGIQPRALEIDRYGKLWCLTDGGYEGSPAGHEAPTLSRIDADSRTVEQTFTFRKGDTPTQMAMNAARDTLYYINGGLWCMDVSQQRLPLRPVAESDGTIFYSLGVDPQSSEVYLGDAIDYTQPGVVYRFTPRGECIDTFRVGIIPASFCFKP